MPEVPKRGWPEAEPQPSPEQMQMAAAQLAQVPLPRPDPRPVATELRGMLQDVRSMQESSERFDREHQEYLEGRERQDFPAGKLSREAGLGDIKRGKGKGFDPEEGPEWTEKVAEAHATQVMSGMHAHVSSKRFAEAMQSRPESENVEDWQIGSVHRNAAQEAQKALGLTVQERTLYDQHLSNLWGKGGVDHPDGSRSTLLRVSFQSKADGKFYNVPSVYDGKILSPEEAIDRAKEMGLEQFPSYRSQREADARYERMHRYMESDTADYFAQRGR
jgi:hypothetical protein